MTAGYSATPLAKKLGLKQGFKIILHNPPDHYFQLMSDLPEDIEVLNTINDQQVDFIHVFCKQMKELTQVVQTYKNMLKKDGMLWISWPKGTSKIETDLNRDLIRDYLLQTGLVDVKVAAIDADWSGLKFIYRLKDR